MKKLLIYLVAIMLLAIGVNGGSIEDLNYKDKVLFWDTNRQVDDYSVKINADTVDGYSAEDLMKDEASVITYNSGGGMNMNSLGNYLFGEYDYFSYFDTAMTRLYQIFVTHSQLEDSNRKIDRLECMVEYPEHRFLEREDCIMQKRADRTCQTHTLNGKDYVPLVLCV